MWEVTFEYPVSINKASDVIYGLAQKYAVLEVGSGVDLHTGMRDVQYEGKKISVDSLAKAVKAKIKSVVVNIRDQDDYSDIPVLSLEEVKKAKSRLKKATAAKHRLDAKWVAKRRSSRRK